MMFKRKIFLLWIIVTLPLAGCWRSEMGHEVDVKPITVDPIHIKVDVNFNVEKGIEEAASEQSTVIGSRAPDFTLMDQADKPFTLNKLQDKWVVLYFYPKDDTPGCTIQAREFSDLLPRFNQLNTEVIGISGDSSESHQAFITKCNITCKLLCDPEHKVMEQYGAWVRTRMGSQFYGRAIRCTILIDPAGIIRCHWPEVIALGHAERVYQKLIELQNFETKS